MAKDPAFLFYSQDFLTGTMFMSNEEIGIYVKLLCAQHQHGGIIKKEDFISVTKDNPNIKSKFVECDEGFYNERLTEEMIKRSKKSANLSQNAKKGWALRKKSKSNANASNLHMPIENENEDENEIKKENKKIRKSATFKPPTLQEVKDYCQERRNSVDCTQFIDFYESKGWMVGKNKMKSWKASVRTWEKRDGTTSVKVDNIPRKKADPRCVNCRGTGILYAPGTGKNNPCGCTEQKWGD